MPHERNPHSRGGITTRDDATEVGVEMLPGDPREPVGPEDALGPGPKRGRYADRLDGGPSVELRRLPDGTIVQMRQDVPAEAHGRTPDEVEIDDPGGPLDASDPERYARLLAQRQRQGT